MDQTQFPLSARTEAMFVLGTAPCYYVISDNSGPQVMVYSLS